MNRAIAAAALLLALAACATGPRTGDAGRLALLEAHAGEPVGSILHPGRFAGWSAVGDGAVVLRPSASRAFLVELTGPCPDLPHAHAIHVSSRAGAIAARFDTITPVGPGTSTIRIPCHIRSIRPLDTAALRSAEEALREATPVEREDGDAR